MKLVGVSIISENCALIDVATVDSVEAAVAKFISNLAERLDGSKIELVLATTEDSDLEFSAQVEKKLFSAVPELFVDHYEWSESY